MDKILENLLRAGVQGSVLIGVILLLRLLLHRAPKRMICILWLLAALRLVLPFSLESNLSLQPRTDAIIGQQYEEAELPGIIVMDAWISESAEGVADPPLTVQNAELSENNITVPDRAEVNSFSASDLTAYIWIAGTGSLLLYCVVSYIVLRRRVREALKLGSGIWESDRIDTAFILGYLRPRIYIPTYISGDERNLVLKHEQTHLRWGDHWVKLMGFCALAIHWFNPLAWVGFCLMGQDLEAACDEQVVRNMDLEGRKRYSGALLSCGNNRVYLTPCPIAFGEKPVKRRILAVLRYRKPGFWISLGAVAAIAVAVLCFMTSPVERYESPEIPQLQYTVSDVVLRVTESANPEIVFSGNTVDTQSPHADYRFDPAIPEAERNRCVFYSDGIISRVMPESTPEIVVLAEYDGAWTDGKRIYLGAQDFTAPDFGAELIVNLYGGFANYGAAYGYAEYIGVQSGWRGEMEAPGLMESTNARDLNALCFREAFVTSKEIEENRKIACAFVRDIIEANGEDAFLTLLAQSGNVHTVSAFCEILGQWYAAYGLDYRPSDILYAPGGEYHDYLAKCFYATFLMPKAWENRHYSALAPDGKFLHESYEDVKFYFETASSQMVYIQELFGVHEDTSDITVEFLLSGVGATWAARNQIQLTYHGYIPRSYLNMMLYRHTILRDHGGSYFEWLYLGLGEYTAQMMPSVYEDEMLLYSTSYGNRGYSTMEGDWYRIWQELIKGETDPDKLWRTRWELLAYYYDSDLHNGAYGQIAFTAYLADQVGIETLWDYLLQTENPCPDIDFAQYRTRWEAYLEETYGMYPRFGE